LAKKTATVIPNRNEFLCAKFFTAKGKLEGDDDTLSLPPDIEFNAVYMCSFGVSWYLRAGTLLPAGGGLALLRRFSPIAPTLFNCKEWHGTTTKKEKNRSKYQQTRS